MLILVVAVEAEAKAIGPIEGDACAFLKEALVAATADQRARFAGQCGIAFRKASNTRSDHQLRYRVSSASAWSAVRAG